MLLEIKTLLLITLVVGDDVVEDVVEAIGILLTVRTSLDQIVFAK